MTAYKFESPQLVPDAGMGFCRVSPDQPAIIAEELGVLLAAPASSSSSSSSSSRQASSRHGAVFGAIVLGGLGW